MMVPSKYGTMVVIPRENRSTISFKKNENKEMKNYIDDGIGNYAILIT